MKDYTLSEAKKICEQHRTCGDCPLKIITQHGIGCMFWIMPRNWQNPIEPRDMVELPYKVAVTACNGQVLSWQTVRRSDTTGDLIIKYFNTEIEADKFLQELKGEKK